MRRLILMLLLSILPPSADSVAFDLPPLECVQQLRSARIALEKGQVDAGLSQLKATVEAFPDELVPLVELWKYHRRHARRGDDADDVRAILTRRLADPESEIPPGVLQYLVEDRDAGPDELELVLVAAAARLAREPEAIPLLKAVADLQLRLEKKVEARTTLGRLFKIAPTDGLRWACIRLDLDLERWADVASQLEPLLDRSTPVPWARLLYTEALSKLGRHDELAAQWLLLAEEGALPAEMLRVLLFDAAWDARDLGNDGKAEEMFRQILDSDPSHQGARSAVLHLYSTVEEQQAHRKALESAWNSEEDPDALLAAGGKLLAAGDAVSARPLLERAAAALPSSEIAWYNLGLAAFQQEDWARAESALERATEINPARAESLFNRGAALQKLDRCTEAIAVINKLLTAQPEMTQAYYYLYVCHAALGQSEQAQDALKRYNAR